MISQKRIRELVRYDEGKLFWIYANSYRVKVGSRAGYYDPIGNRRYIRMDWKLYGEHQIIWVLHNGPIPKGYEIDHKDRNATNNLLSNLRLGTKSQNNYNKKPPPISTSGYKGICFDKRDNVWQAYINVNGVRKSLGRHETKEKAATAYNLAAIKYHGEFALLNEIK